MQLQSYPIPTPSPIYSSSPGLVQVLWYSQLDSASSDFQDAKCLEMIDISRLCRSLWKSSTKRCIKKTQKPTQLSEKLAFKIKFFSVPQAFHSANQYTQVWKEPWFQYPILIRSEAAPSRIIKAKVIVQMSYLVTWKSLSSLVGLRWEEKHSLLQKLRQRNNQLK